MAALFKNGDQGVAAAGDGAGGPDFGHPRRVTAVWRLEFDAARTPPAAARRPRGPLELLPVMLQADEF